MFWFAIQVKSRHELTTAAILRNKGYDEFVPLYYRKQRWSDRYKLIEYPLFQGYVFCRFNPEIKAPIVTTPGVIRIVGSAKQPLPIDDKEMHMIEMIAISGVKAEPYPYLEVGDRVIVNDGPLAGIEGILTSFKNRQIVISVHAVRRSICVDVGSCSLTPVSSGTSNRCVGAFTGTTAVRPYSSA